ncbi:uncharacterized protein C14orf119 homolog isoform X2 [Corythoichthys intestinalis]|uniref:uncharacterized protein C14orf119 homolog isoform X2 n=1 Tax=Corythoichthys intestinalis TaxID=161448 RepID=UPI0025A5926D|nr:uncharacterized protein C14orf119 homolog isoform X2 [Corythoichthys intestinalis]XP_061794792.1 uncharacterized protein C14orf119 homolog [Nerophis lumbriciformis]
MSWFNYVSQNSDHQQFPTESSRMSATDGLCAPYRSGLWGAPMTVASPAVATQERTGFASTPQGVSCPPTLENLTCGSPSGGQVTEPVPISYVSLQEQRCVLSWFQGWSGSQRERFLQDLVGKAVPGKVCTLLDSLSTLQVKDRLPNIFECQLRLWSQWFESWGEDERNHFLHILEERDPMFVAHFYNCVAGTAGRD